MTEKHAVGRFRFVLGCALLAMPVFSVAQSASSEVPGVRLESVDLSRYEAIVQPSRLVLLRAQVHGPLLIDPTPQEGDRVAKDAILARIEDAEPRAAVEEARLQAEQAVQIQRARKVLEEMEVRLEKAVEMHERQAGTEFEVRQARVQRDLSRIDVELAQRERALAEQRLALAQTRLMKYHLTAPFAGRVVRVAVKGGQTLELGDEVLTLAAMQELEAPMWLPVALYRQFKVGQKYQLTADHAGKSNLVGTVKYVDPLIDSASRTFRVVLVIDNADEALPAGFAVRLVEAKPLPTEQATATAAADSDQEAP